MILEISFEYWNKLSIQTVFITALLGGFSILVIANLLVAEIKTKLVKYILMTSTLAASLFLVSIFAWTAVMMMTTPGYPEKLIAVHLRITGFSEQLHLCWELYPYLR